MDAEEHVREGDVGARPSKRHWHLHSWAQIVASLATVGALVFTGMQANYAQRQNLTDTLGQAVEQLGSEQASVRLLGLNALDRVYRESPEDQSAIKDGLSRFIRDRTIKDLSRTNPEEDVRMALIVVTRPDEEGNTRRIDLRNANLAGVELGSGANFLGAELNEAIFQDAVLQGATLEGADLGGANLANAKLENADFVNANLEGADLRGAHLAGANFRRAKLVGADLTTATGLTQQQLAYACIDQATKLPRGLVNPGPHPEWCA